MVAFSMTVGIAFTVVKLVSLFVAQINAGVR
jgi:hypothetical protein